MLNTVCSGNKAPHLTRINCIMHVKLQCWSVTPYLIKMAFCFKKHMPKKKSSWRQNTRRIIHFILFENLLLVWGMCELFAHCVLQFVSHLGKSQYQRKPHIDNSYHSWGKSSVLQPLIGAWWGLLNANVSAWEYFLQCENLSVI